MTHTATSNSSENEFIAAFENCTLPADMFNHEGHLKITWLYLSRFTFEEAQQKVMTGISAYATHLGAKEKYHATLTWFMVQLVWRRMSQEKTHCWQAFKSQNKDLLVNTKQQVFNCYSSSLMASEKARKECLMPDLNCPEWLSEKSSCLERANSDV